MMSNATLARACPMWHRSYTVTPHTYMRTLPGTSGTNGSFRLPIVLNTESVIPPHPPPFSGRVPRSRATAQAEIPSPRPSNPIPSVVFPLTLTRSSGTARIPAIEARSASASGAIRGASQTTTASSPRRPNPPAAILPRACARIARLEIPRVSSLPGGKWKPMSRSPIAP